MAQDERTEQTDRVGKKWNLAANYLAKGYCHCVLKMRKKKWQKVDENGTSGTLDTPRGSFALMW